MEWFKWFGGASNDPKFHVVARKTNQPMGFVVTVWAMILERASEAEDRGSIAGFDCEAADVVMGMPDGAACAIVEAMRAKGLIDGDRIYRWEERQAPTDRPAKPISTPRVQRFRERQRADAEKSETSSGVDETQRNMNVTAETHKSVSAQFETVETPDGTDETLETGKEEIREDKNIKIPPLPPTGGDAAGEVEQSPPLPTQEQSDATDKGRRKRDPTGNTLPELRQAIAKFTAHEPLRKALEDFRAMRERIRKPLTGRALELILRELENLAPNNPALQVEIVNQSVMRGWQSVFALKGPVRASPGMGDLMGKNAQTMAAVLAARQQGRTGNGL